jgi:hypothetical protein
MSEARENVREMIEAMSRLMKSNSIMSDEQAQKIARDTAIKQLDSLIDELCDARLELLSQRNQA